MTQGIANGFVQGIVTADVFTLEEKFSIAGKEAAMGRPGLAVKRSAIGKTVCQVKAFSRGSELLALMAGL